MNILEKQIFKKVLDKNKVKRPVFKNVIKAFVVGGLISIVAQGLLDLYTIVFNIKESYSTGLMSITLVVLASLLTGLGVYDKVGQFAGAGTIVPITGFSNSITSPAIDFKKEGIIFGLCVKMFSVAGPVIVNGTIISIIVGLIYLFL